MEYKIYKIVCNETDEVYIGSTSRTLEERLKGHISESKRNNETQRRTTSSQIIERCNYYMEELDSTNIQEKRFILERYYIENIPNCINKYIPTRTDKEYYDDNREKNKVYKKEYREKNKEKIKEKRKEKYTCECGSTLTKVGKSLHEKSLTHINFINSK